MPSRLARPATQMKDAYDVIVVGSGYGAGVAASRLARCGRKVAVLERGREFLPGEMPDRASAATRETQVRGLGSGFGAATALFDIRLGKDIHVMMACGLGGTSLINANVCLTPDARVFEDEAWPAEVRADRLLAEGYLRARHMLRPAPYGAFRSLQKVKALERSASVLDRTVEPVPLHIAFSSGPNAAGVDQPACTLCGDCCAGCNVGAKTTVANTYLADAARLGAEIFVETRVDTIRKDGDGQWIVAYDCPGGSRPGERRGYVKAPIVVLGAGTLGSTEILLKSREAGLALSAELGKRFTSNGDALANGYNNVIPVNGVGVGHPPKVDAPPVGAAVNGLIDLRNTGNVREGLAIVECALPSAFAGMLPALFVPGGAVLGQDMSGGWRDELDEMGRALASLVGGAYRGAVHNTQTFLAVGHDEGNGVMILKNGRVVVEWEGAPRQAVFGRIEAALKKATEATGGTYMRNPASEKLMGGNLLTVHPLGGCVMGADRGRGVVNHKGQVFDATPDAASDSVHEGLYVMDGAVIPCSLGVHPLLTITALAERTMIHMARDRGWPLDVTSRPWIGQAGIAPAPPPSAGPPRSERQRGAISAGLARLFGRKT